MTGQERARRAAAVLGLRRTPCGRSRPTHGSVVLGLICFLVARRALTRLRIRTRVRGCTAMSPANLTRVWAALVVFGGIRGRGWGLLCRSAAVLPPRLYTVV